MECQDPCGCLAARHTTRRNCSFNYWQKSFYYLAVGFICKHTNMLAIMRCSWSQGEPQNLLNIGKQHLFAFSAVPQHSEALTHLSVWSVTDPPENTQHRYTYTWKKCWITYPSLRHHEHEPGEDKYLVVIGHIFLHFILVTYLLCAALPLKCGAAHSDARLYFSQSLIH